jgi:hypothetical protein
MEAPEEISSFREGLQNSAASTLGPTGNAEDNGRLEVVVVYTSVDATIAAIKLAAGLANSLDGRITLLVIQRVPYPLPLEEPPVLLDFSKQRFRDLASLSSVETSVRVYLCREPLKVLTGVLRPHSVIVIGGQKSWWPTREAKLVGKLRRAGHEVILTEGGE